jgi:hypothetical protein
VIERDHSAARAVVAVVGPVVVVAVGSVVVGGRRERNVVPGAYVNSFAVVEGVHH